MLIIIPTFATNEETRKIISDNSKKIYVKIAKIILENNCDLIILGLTRIECDEKFLWKPNKYYDNEVISDMIRIC